MTTGKDRTSTGKDLTNTRKDLMNTKYKIKNLSPHYLNKNNLWDSYWLMKKYPKRFNYQKNPHLSRNLT